MIKLKAIIAALLFISSAASVAEKLTPKGVGCDTDSGVCYVILDRLFANPECSKNQLRLDPLKPGTKGQYSAALAAFMAGKYIEVGSTTCYQDHPTPSYLYVTD